MVAWGDLFGKDSAAGQLLLWQVGGQVIGTLLGPTLTAAQQEIWQATVDGSGGHVSVVLSPAELADMVVRGIRPQADAQTDATKSGISAQDFQFMVESAGEPPGLQFVLEAWRRGYVDWPDTGPESPSVERALKTSRVYDYWSQVVQQMALVPIAVGEAVDAVVEGQITFDQGATAAYANGVSKENFQILVNTRGNPPSPTQLITLYRRGLIPMEGTGPDVTSVQQGIFEGATKDKWWRLLADLSEYLPPPRTITTLEREGVITQAQAVDLYQKAGLSPTLAAAYSASATAAKTTTHKQLAESAVLNLYESKLITQAQAVPMLGNLGYDASEAALILKLADHNQATKSVNSAITKVRTLFTGRKIDAAGARKALADLGVPGDQISALMEVWIVEAQTNVKDLTESQIVDAWDYGIIKQDEAMAQLQTIGYTPWDAWVILSVKNKGPLPNEPAKGPGPSPAVT